MAIITISRGTYSGGRALAECLGEHLGYRVTSREELLKEAAAEFEASEEELEGALMHRAGFLERRRLGRLHYIHCLEAALAKAARGDNLVYHGQAGQLLLRAVPHHLRVLVVADREYRIAAARERDGVSKRRAIKLIRDADEARDEWVRRIYGVDRDDLATYDLTVNLENVQVQSACEIIVHLVESQFRSSPESQVIMDDLVLASEVRARIGIDEDIVDDDIGINASHGHVTVSGRALNRRESVHLERLVRQIPGVVDVECLAGSG